MKKYEMVREIFNQCQNNQMRYVFFEEIETDDLDAVVEKICGGKENMANMDVEVHTTEKGTTLYYINTANFHQKVSFTEIE